WFTSQGQGGPGKIERMSTSAQFTEYTGLAGSNPIFSPTGMAVDASGDIWFADGGDDQLGRISQGGTISEYAAPTYGPVSLALAADGNLYYTEFSSLDRLPLGGPVNAALPVISGTPNQGQTLT